MGEGSLPVKRQRGSDEDKGTESQLENHSGRLLMVDPALVGPAGTRLNRLRTVASLCLPKSRQSVGSLATSSRNRSYKDEFALVHVHHVSFHAHTP